MGNRALVAFCDFNHHEAVKDGQPTPVPAVYLHYSGSDVRAWLQELRELMIGRDHDAAYAVARFAQIAGAHIGGNMSLGIEVIDLQDPDAEAEPARGNAGLFVVDVRSAAWGVSNYGGNERHGAFEGLIFPYPNAKPRTRARKG